MAKTTQEQRDANEDRNIRAIADFRNYWTEKHKKLPVNSTGLVFKAQISYQSPRRSILEHANVRICLTGYGTDGTIDIFDTPKMTADDYHLKLVAAFGEYKLNSSTGELIVSNESAKMGGDYSVRILPIGAADKP